MAGVRFIRKNGRVIPIRDSGPSVREVHDAQQAALALPAGVLAGFGAHGVGKAVSPLLLEKHLEASKRQALFRYRANLRGDGAREMFKEAERIGATGAKGAAEKLTQTALAMQKSSQRGYRAVGKLGRVSFRAFAGAKIAGGLALPILAGLATFALIAPKRRED